MHGTANCRTIAIMHHHRDAQVSIDRILYTQDSELRLIGNKLVQRSIKVQLDPFEIPCQGSDLAF